MSGTSLIGRSVGLPVICDTVVLRNFLLVDAIDLLRTAVGSPLHVPTVVFANDPGDLAPEARSELRQGLDFHQRKLATLRPGSADYANEEALVERFAGLYSLVESGDLVCEDLSLAELSRFARLTDRTFRQKNGFPTRVHRGEAAALAIAEARGWILATDDRDGLRAAAKLGIETRQTREILIGAVSAGLTTLAEARRLHLEMRSHGFWDEPWL